MPQPADDDPTVRLTKPFAGVSAGAGGSPASSPASRGTIARAPGAISARRVSPLAIALPALAVVLAVVGGLYLGKSAPTPPPVATTAAPVSRAGLIPPSQTTPTQTTSAQIAPPQIAPPQIAPAQGALALATSEATQPPARTGTAITPVLLPLPVEPAHPAIGQQEFRIETGTEQSILDHVPPGAAPDLTVFRFKPNPRILVLDFTSLREQGRMLNRAAALIEKSGLPHDRLLSEVDLVAAIRAGGDTVETFYYGHDYSSAELIRFFALAERDNIALLEEEDALGHLIRQEGWFEANARGGLISIPQIGADEHVTRAARATILHHELSHGEYFTNPTYAAFVHRFWTQTLTSAERDHIRRHLQSDGYDSNLEEVMENEAQAYLMFTDGAEFFTPEMIGMSNARLAELRAGFYRAMPAGWLRDSLGQTLSASKVVVHP